MKKKLLFFITIIFIFFIYIFFFNQIILTMIKYEFIHFYGVMGGTLSYGTFDHPPRSSGMARFSLVLFFVLLISFLQSERFKNLKLLGILFFLTNVLLYHSRTMSFIFLFINLFVIIFYF